MAFLRTGLNCEAVYVSYAWAYNNCGYSTPVTLEQSTTECCGDTFIINHMASNGVAPVDKSVTYGTVINITGDLSKCWITSNLGADHQADSVNDGTETSAGWYWQFNKKQGYKHDGISRTPNTTWIPGIWGNSNWTAVNDPCSLELGSNWRIPTHTEWGYVYMFGEWYDWDDAWDSPLKMHAAGSLSQITASLDSRGSTGNYWTSTSPYDGSEAVQLYFDNVNLYLIAPTSNKACGFSVRCIRE